MDGGGQDDGGSMDSAEEEALLRGPAGQLLEKAWRNFIDALEVCVCVCMCVCVCVRVYTYLLEYAHLGTRNGDVPRLSARCPCACDRAVCCFCGCWAAGLGGRGEGS